MIAHKKQRTRQYRLPKTAHTSHPWRIHGLTSDFILEDVWAMPTPGGAKDFRRLIAALASGGAPEEEATPIGRFLFALRWKLGKWFGWDRKGTGLDSRVISLRERLPEDLRHTNVPVGKESPFTPLYITNDEYALELANSTMHGVMHMSWVEDGCGGYRGQMAVLVKSNGWFGKLYMAAIKPFRYLFIYPPLMRKFERKWKQAQINFDD